MKMSKDQKRTKQESSKPNCLNGLLQPQNLLPINIKGRKEIAAARSYSCSARTTLIDKLSMSYAADGICDSSSDSLSLHSSSFSIRIRDEA